MVRNFSFLGLSNLRPASIILLSLLAWSCGDSDDTYRPSPPDTPATNAQPASNSPNFIIILSDDEPIGYGSGRPWIAENIFSKGVDFKNAFVTTSLCCPSRVSFLTGLYAHNHGVLSNAGRGGATQFAASGLDASTINVWLQSAGYQTAWIGKFLNQYPVATLPIPPGPPYIPPGWSKFFAPIDVYPNDTPYGQYNYGIVDDGVLRRYGSSSPEYFGDVVGNESLEFIRDALADGRPFFLVVGFISPHIPATYAKRHGFEFPRNFPHRTESFNETDISDKPAWLRDRALLSTDQQSAITTLHRDMLRSLRSVDEYAHFIHTLLSNSGALHNTYIAYVSDNGAHMGEHRISHDKNTFYEEAIRVPMAIIGPGIAAGSTIEEPVLNIDLAATIAELAGLSPPDTDGRSLRALIEHGQSDVPWRTRFLVEHFAPYAEEALVPDSRPNRLEYSAIRSEEEIYAEYSYGDYEYYDLLEDPDELDNRVLQLTPGELDRLRTLLDSLRYCRGQSCRDAEL